MKHISTFEKIRMSTWVKCHDEVYTVVNREAERPIFDLACPLAVDNLQMSLHDDMVLRLMSIRLGV